MRFLRFLIGGTLFALGFIITDKTDLLDLVNTIKERLKDEQF